MSLNISEFDNSDYDALWDGRGEGGVGVLLWTYQIPDNSCELSHNCELLNWLVALLMLTLLNLI